MNQIVKVNTLLAQRQSFLSQKSRLQWLQDGDRNSDFFHRLHSSIKARASINTFQIGSDFIMLASEIGHHVVDYYEKFFKEDASPSSDYSILDSFAWKTLSAEQNSILTATPSVKEVSTIIFDLDPASSPGPMVSWVTSIRVAGTLFPLMLQRQSAISSPPWICLKELTLVWWLSFRRLLTRFVLLTSDLSLWEISSIKSTRRLLFLDWAVLLGTFFLQLTSASFWVTVFTLALLLPQKLLIIWIRVILVAWP